MKLDFLNFSKCWILLLKNISFTLVNYYFMRYFNLNFIKLIKRQRNNNTIIKIIS